MKNILLFGLLLALFTTTYGQKTERDGNYHFKSENYSVALDIYQSLYKADTANININYRLGVCYLNCNSNPKAALTHLEFISASKESDPIYYFELGKAYLYNYKFANATESFTKSKNLSAKNPEFSHLSTLWLSMTENAKKLTREPLDVSFINLGKYINSKMDELTPVISADGENLFYTSNRKFDRSYNLYTYDIFYSEISYNAFKKGKAFTAANTMDDELIAGISATGDRVFVQLQGYDAFEDIAECTRRGKGFDKKNLLLGQVNSKSAESGAALSLTGDTLFFSSNREGGKGGFDIYYSKRLPTGEWGIPINLSDKINTAYDEDFPHMSVDGRTLYFCSNGPNSMGGFDVFKTILQANGEFSEPINLGFPLNDVFDNKTVAFSANQRYAYVSAIRSDGFGYSDVYRVIFNQQDPSVKLFIVKMKTGTKENNAEFAATDTTLAVTAFKKGKIVFGKYAYDANSSQSTIALPPGNYILEISGKTTETKSMKITVEDVPGKDKIIKETVFLEPKK